VVWVGKTKSGAALEEFYEALGPDGAERLEAVSMDLGSTYRQATRRCAPDAVICFHPFHVIQLPNRALDSVYKSADHGDISGRQWRKVRAAFVNLAQTIARNFDGIIAAIELGLSNSRLEGINSKIRVNQRRGYGPHTAESLADMIFLCLGGITIRLPTQT
jgi:transposase